METAQQGRIWWLITAAATLLAWLVGAYLPPVANLWVELNLITPAGQPHLAAFPYDYPAVGIDGHTLCSLAGIVIMVAAVTRWISYLERHTPPAPALTPEIPTMLTPQQPPRP